MPSAAERENFQMNRAAYNRIGVQWDAARTGFFGREQAYLDTLLAGLPDGSTILDVGCGTGRPMAEYVVARGHRVVGVDKSEELLAKAVNRFPDQAWIHAGLENYPFEGEYQVVICWDALFHIERRHHEELIGRMADCLPTGGRLMLTVGGSDHPAITDAMFGQEFFYDSFPPQQALRMLDGLGLVAIVGEFMNEPTSGRDKGRYAIVVTKR